MNRLASSFSIVPGNWLGIVGGGQLGRMFCHAAQSLGYKVAVLDPAAPCPAGVAADLHIQAGYDDVGALDRLSALCQAVTTEFENVPAASLERLALNSRVCPAAEAVAIVQDRLSEKAFIQGLGVPVAPHAPVCSAADLAAVPNTLFPGILKVARMGYDGKGQARVATREEAAQAFAEFKNTDCVLEALMPLDFEISVVMARGLDGSCVAYAPALNEHRDGILAVSTVPQQTVETQQALYEQAFEAAMKIAQGLGYCGVLCVEFFVLQDGSLVVNEIAPRPHNSGHYTLNACVSSQFEQQARAMAGLPLGSTANLCSCVMLNILGDVWFDEAGMQREPDWAALLAVPNAKLHLYGKAEARRGRKMGHVNVLGGTLDQAREAAARVAHILGIRF
ncbi:5-(carboxyamino)imidazole ribonucleotide synthase [Eoetvoesiella caeni]|uniref:N5-carboxyaminoimidazole ribonucleotide synthase n=1 Tax=Eoetvoesiella caeni TaxID=645616 RepID=A0A366HAR4_9BURK|nr:5-(carboxyamino)imidazole ribonucleotide synthase [Eoetvoesiella caeni]MCI2809262.1 5-(carboxyamino)imidazole ribonucleotide synthase [Eoetvoesiella caeni]NYT54402.1 5-(carboxyamino)imidazole ribonucleotide synthase [Eoetvoesiella caeni]RBP39410.1 5-(carboxyamino)imidazole ribonucleotide synthase [Eoetvoesiella caeni]